MTSRISLVLAATAACAAWSGALSAHHSTAAEFDRARPITFTGTVKKVQWMNPHIYTLIDVKGSDGALITYSVEGGPPNSLFRRGWRVSSLKVGETVTVSGIRAKSDASLRIGQATITTADGKRVFVDTGPDRKAVQQ